MERKLGLGLLKIPYFLDLLLRSILVILDGFPHLSDLLKLSLDFGLNLRRLPGELEVLFVASHQDGGFIVKH